MKATPPDSHLSATDLFSPGLPALWKTVDDATGAGVFFRASEAIKGCYGEIALGRIAGLKRYTAGFRVSPFWMQPALGTDEADLPPETQWLLAELESGDFALVAPLFDGPTRYSLKGTKEGLAVVAETGDPSIPIPAGVALFAGVDSDPYALLAASARAIATRLGEGRLRAEKPVPDFVDLFGWCTWDAFYKEVSAEKVRQGLESFRAGGVEPRLLILDDGWQSVETAPTGEDRLTSMEPNERFGGDLRPTVRVAKEEFQVRCLLIWHALLGYWGGLDDDAFSDYGTRTVARSFGPGILARGAAWNVQPWGPVLGVPGADQAERFFDDYHRMLAEQGIDGVKVDNQAMLEAVSAGQGGRVALARAFRHGLERSVSRHFSGRLINCMCCATEGMYLAAESTVIRGSDDFYPRKPDTHGAHLFINAHVDLWLGEFMLPDWDMFQSAHPSGSLHAAARAICGGPVYVSDKPGEHDFALLRKLVLSDGTILRADRPARLTADLLFTDPRVEPVLLKVFNHNRDCGVVGLFNVQHHDDPKDRRVIPGATCVEDVIGLAGDAFAAFAHRSGRVWRCGRTERKTVELAEADWELVSYAPVENGFAALGLADKFNSTGAIVGREWISRTTCLVRLRDGGTFVGWSEIAPLDVQCDGAAVTCRHDPASGRLSMELPVGGSCSVQLTWNPET